MKAQEARRRLVRVLPDAFWTLANNILNVVGGLAVIKLISSLVAEDQYGEASLVLGIVALLVQFVVNPLLTAHLRLHFDELRRGGGADFMHRLGPLLTKSGLAMAAAYLLIALVYLWRGHPAYLALLPPAFLLLFLQPRLSATFNLLEAQRKYRRLTVMEMLSKIAPAGLLALLLATPLARANTVVLAQGLAVGGVFLLSRPRRDSAAGEAESGAASQEPRSAFAEFGWTLYVFNVVSWIMTTSDRYLIEYFWSPREVGLYAMNYGFCAIPFQMVNAWLEIFTRSRLYTRAAGGDWRAVRTIILSRLAVASFLTASGVLLLYLIGQPIALAIVGTRYWQGLRLAMLVGIAHVFFVAGNSFHILFIAAKRAEILLWTAVVAAGANVGLNLWLVPRMGILGAAVSTLAAYVIWCVILVGTGLALLRRLTAEAEAPIA